MSLKDIAFYLVCAASWCVVLPLVAIGGMIAMVSYAVFSEMNDVLRGRPQAIDSVTARELARRMCLRH